MIFQKNQICILKIMQLGIYFETCMCKSDAITDIRWIKNRNQQNPISNNRDGAKILTRMEKYNTHIEPKQELDGETLRGKQARPTEEKKLSERRRSRAREQLLNVSPQLLIYPRDRTYIRV